MKKLLIILLLPLQALVFAQSNIGLKLDLGISQISEQIFSNDNTRNPALSGNFGIVYNKKIGPKSIFGSELLISKIQGIENRDVDYFNSLSGYAGTFNLDFISEIYYLNLPIHYGYHLKKFTINVGLQLSFLLHAQFQEVINNTNNSVRVAPVKQELNTLNYAPRIGVNYKISEKFFIEGTCFYGINNILLRKELNELRIQQATVGIRYLIFTRDAKTGLAT